jgi:phage gp29-like protein
MNTGLSSIKNIFFPTDTSAMQRKQPTDNAQGGYNLATGIDSSPDAVKKNLSNYITPVQLQRLKVDVGEHRKAIGEAEFAWYPHRVRMQRMYIDTIVNGHVYSCMERRKDLTLLRGFEMAKKQGDKWVASKDLTEEFESYSWLHDYIEYCLDALFFGYSLVSLGDIVGGELQGIDLIRRWNVSPDRMVVNTMVYNLDGRRWDTDETKPWHIYVKTKSENGVSPCGYGLLYKIALYEIFLRNVLGYNGDFVELYSQPYRVGKTTKTTEAERAQLEEAVRNMGSAGYAILDPFDEIEFLETALGGTGWQGYDNLEKRCMQTISKIVLGHGDAMDSVPGKLGAGNGTGGPVAEAMEDKQTKDGRFISPLVNRELMPRLRDLGVTKAPEEYVWRLKNDDETAEQRKREDESNAQTATIAKTMKDGGLKMDAVYFTDRTGIPAEAVEEPAPVAPGAPGTPNPQKLKNKMEELYGK